jgi:hypothetical protein
MKLAIIMSLVIMLAIPTSFVPFHVFGQFGYHPPPDVIIKGLEQEAQQLQDQNSKYLQMIYILIGLIIALSVEIIVIYAKYLRKKNMKEKINPES